MKEVAQKMNGWSIDKRAVGVHCFSFPVEVKCVWFQNKNPERNMRLMHLFQVINTLKIKLNLSKPTHKFFNLLNKMYNPKTSHYGRNNLGKGEVEEGIHMGCGTENKSNPRTSFRSSTSSEQKWLLSNLTQSVTASQYNEQKPFQKLK